LLCETFLLLAILAYECRYIGSLVDCLVVGCLGGCRIGAVVMGEFRSEGRDFGKEEFTFYTSGVCVVEHGPYGYLSSAIAQKHASQLTRSSSCLRACSMTPSCPFRMIHIRDKSLISVWQTTSESRISFWANDCTPQLDVPMLKPLPARIPDTRDKTPGSFCTKQFNRCLTSATDSEHMRMIENNESLKPERGN